MRGLHCHSIDDSRGGSGRKRVADFLSCYCVLAAGHADPSAGLDPDVGAGHLAERRPLAKQVPRSEQMM